MKGEGVGEGWRGSRREREREEGGMRGIKKGRTRGNGRLGERHKVKVGKEKREGRAMGLQEGIVEGSEGEERKTRQDKRKQESGEKGGRMK